MRNDKFQGTTLRNGIELLPLKGRNQPITPEMVERIEAEEDLREAKIASDLARGPSDLPEEP